MGNYANREVLNDALKTLKTGFFVAKQNNSGDWDLYETDGIYARLVYVNGILGGMGRHASLGIAHLDARFKDVTQFTIAHNSSHRALLDILETAGDILGIKSKASRQLAAKLESALESGRKVTLVAHSQGFATTVSALRQLAVKNFDASGLTIYPHAGAANSFYAGSLARSVNATLMPHAFSSWDLVPTSVGMNGNILQVFGGMLASPKLASIDETRSPHTLVNSGGGPFPWFGWAPGS